MSASEVLVWIGNGAPGDDRVGIQVGVLRMIAPQDIHSKSTRKKTFTRRLDLAIHVTSLCFFQGIQSLAPWLYERTKPKEAFQMTSTPPNLCYLAPKNYFTLRNIAKVISVPILIATKLMCIAHVHYLSIYFASIVIRDMRT